MQHFTSVKFMRKQMYFMCEADNFIVFMLLYVFFKMCVFLLVRRGIQTPQVQTIDVNGSLKMLRNNIASKQRTFCANALAGSCQPKEYIELVSLIFSHSLSAGPFSFEVLSLNTKFRLDFSICNIFKPPLLDATPFNNQKYNT